ncbi:MAG: DUF1569 domain-containing protein [Planctomycetes bacterium]|nr:DUF1569 domain-containing protein [Planctomycetota bacterium]
MIDTKKVTDRRRLSFTSLEDIQADVEALDGSAIRTTGNWTAAQIVQHVTDVITLSVDGFGFRLALPLRVLGRSLRSQALTRPMRPGFSVPEAMRARLPSDQVPFEQAIASLRQAIGRAKSERMTKASPLLGALTHEQWVQFHSRHAEMHLSFVHPAAV